ncbi:MAG: glycosyltransferase family 25 protein [Gammaproteobacteria bacterium]
MKLDDFFPHQVCINLDRRKDRWERMRARFARHNIGQVVRFPALDGKSLDIPSIWDDFPGAYGCLCSHLAVVEQAREDAQQSVLIFEDDTMLDPQFNTRFAEYIKQVPEDWDMVFFGGIHGKSPARMSRNVMRVTHSLSTYAYAMKHTIYDGFIELNRQALTVLDENTRALQKRFNCYCFMPHLAWVEEGYSDVREERINLWWLSESLVLWGREVDQILEKTVAVIYHCVQARLLSRI